MFRREARFENLIAATTTVVAREYTDGDPRSKQTAIAIFVATKDALHENNLVTRRGNLKRWVGRRLREATNVPPATRKEINTDASKDSLDDLYARITATQADVERDVMGLVRTTVIEVIRTDAAARASERAEKRIKRMLGVTST
jgi:hypothetical protein